MGNAPATLDVIGDMVADIQRKALKSGLTYNRDTWRWNPRLITNRHPGHMDLRFARASSPRLRRFDVEKTSELETAWQAFRPAHPPGEIRVYYSVPRIEPGSCCLDPGSFEIIVHLLHDLLRLVRLGLKGTAVLIGNMRYPWLSRVGSNTVTAEAAICTRQEYPRVGQ